MEEIPKHVIEAAANGDAAAFEEIYRITADYVYSIAFRITGSREEGQEVVQDVFVKIYNNLNRFDFRSKLKTWIYRITVNTAINHYNKFKKKKQREVNGEEWIENIPDRRVTVNSVENKESEKRVSEMLENLNADQKACILLREIEGLSYEEISETLRININTVRTRLKRARAKLLKVVTGKGGSHEVR